MRSTNLKSAVFAVIALAGASGATQRNFCCATFTGRSTVPNEVFASDPERKHVSEQAPRLLDQLADRFHTVRNRAQASYFTIRLRDSNSDSLGMDIQTKKS
jgi:hypothetical protein